MSRFLKVLMASALVVAFAVPAAASADEAPAGARADLTVAVAAADAQADLTISTVDDFAKFAAAVNSGTTYVGKTVVLAKDIELAADTPSVGVVSQNDFIYQIDKSFQGTFDGQGHSILLKGKPLFGILYGTEMHPAQVKNLVLGGSVTVDAPYAGALTTIADGHVKMENVGNNANVTNTHVLYASAGSGTGGLVGYVPATYNSYYNQRIGKFDSLTLTGCYNKGTVTSSCECTGGLVGSFQGKNAPLVIDRCYVSGAVTSTQKYVGGIVGRLMDGDGMRVMEFKNSYIAGKLETSVVVDEARDSQFVGTLVGYSNTSLPGAGKVANVFCGGDHTGGQPYGDIKQETFKSIIPAGVPYLNLTNGDTTLASLNAAPADDATPYTAENGFTFAQDATSDDLPQLFWEAGAAEAPIAKPQATMPTAVTGLTYTGSPQAGVTPLATDGCGYTMEGWQSTDAGTHTATVTLAEGYEWSDGAADAQRTVVYSIGKATLTARYRGETIEADGTPALEVAVTGFKNGETAKTAKGYVAPTIAKPATTPGSTYELTPQGGSAANYDFTYVAGTLMVNAVPKPQLTVANTTISIDTRGSAVQVFVIRDGSILTVGTHYTLSFTDAAGAALAAAPTKAGSYVAVVTGAGDYEGTVSQAFTLEADLEADTPSGSDGETKASTPSNPGTDTGTSTDTGTGAGQASSTSTSTSASAAKSTSASSTASSSTATKATTKATVKVGATFKVTNATGTYTYKITSVKAGAKAATLTKASVKSGKAASVNTAKYKGTTYKVTAVAAKAFKSSKAKSVTLGANVKKIGASALAGAKATTLTVKSKALTKANVKNSLKGSKVTKVKVPKGYAKKYAKLFTKANAGKKVTVA